MRLELVLLLKANRCVEFKKESEGGRPSTRYVHFRRLRALDRKRVFTQVDKVASKSVVVALFFIRTLLREVQRVMS